MTPLQQLQTILNETYISADGNEFKAIPQSALSSEQIATFTASTPGRLLPPEITELLQFAKGFEFGVMGEISFTDQSFGMEELFPNAIELAKDGAGNCWVLDISSEGKWGPVFFVCHDPAVIIKNSNNLGDFLQDLDEFCKNSTSCIIGEIVGDTSLGIWAAKDGLIDIKTARNSKDEMLADFTSGLPDSYVIADLRNKPVGSSFAWGKFGPDIESAVRHSTELIWGIEKIGYDTQKTKPSDATKKSIWSKWFGR